MKIALMVLAGLVVLGGGAYYVLGQRAESVKTEQTAQNTSTSTKSTVIAGTYTVNTQKSNVGWSAKKPLIEGYVNSGTIGLSAGEIVATDATAQATFVIDMNTLDVGLTAKKPGREGALEEHLKKADFFDVAKYPTATFTIKGITPRADSATTFMYDVRGDLTMKGQTHEVTFPAEIYMQDGMLHTHAITEIDRTKWGITYGSGNFFSNLADNAVADEVELSLVIIAEKK